DEGAGGRASQFGAGGGRHTGRLVVVGADGGQGSAHGGQLGREVHFHGFGRARADLEGHRAGAQLAFCTAHEAGGAAGAEQAFTTEGGVAHDVGKLLAQGVELVLHGGLVVVGGRSGGRFRGQVFHAQQDFGDFIERAISSLHHGDAVLCVVLGNRHARG